MNMFAWVIRAVAINEYQSEEYSEVVDNGATQGEIILERFGFTIKGEVFGYEWIWWTVLFCIGLCIMSMLASVWCLNHVRYATGKAAEGGAAVNKDDEKKEDVKASQNITLPVKGKFESHRFCYAPKLHNVHTIVLKTGATLTFKDIHYTVTASTSKDKLELLKGVSGYFASGKMTALMGSSG
jgi:hypothetical protein